MAPGSVCGKKKLPVGCHVGVKVHQGSLTSQQCSRLGISSPVRKNHCEMMPEEVEQVDLTGFLLNAGLGSPDTFSLRTKRTRDSSGISSDPTKYGGTHIPVTPALGMRMQEDHKFKASLSHKPI